MTKPFRHGWAIVAVLGFGVACPPRALAQSIAVDPVILHLSPGRRATLLRITNRGTEPTQLQLRAYGWSQASSGQDQLTAADDVVIGPPFATLAPGATQIVRLLLRAPPSAPATRERAYRLIVDRLPNPAAVVAKGTIQMRLNLSLPVFVDPAPGPAPAPTLAQAPAWRIEGAAGHRELVVVNNGNVHLRIDGLSLTQPGAAPLAVPGNGSRYVLAGVERRWTLPAGASVQPGKPISLTVKNGAGQATVLLAAPAA